MLHSSYSTSALSLLPLRELLFTVCMYSGLRPSVRGRITYDNGNLRNLRYTKNICHVILALITWESAYPITPVEPLKPRFWHNFELCLLFSRKQQQIFCHMLLTLPYSESAYPITPVETLKAILYHYFGISVYFVYFMFI